MSITQRLMLTFSLLSAALIAMVITSVVVVSNFQARFQYVQENTLPSVLDIGKMIDGSNTLLSGSTVIRIRPTLQVRQRLKKRSIRSLTASPR